MAEFLQVLDPMAGLFHEDSLVYRGVSSHRYGLTPTAHRTGKVLLNSYSYVEGPQPTDHEQCRAELFTISRFFDIAAKHGVRLTEDSYTLRANLEEWKRRLTWKDFAPYVWPPPSFYSLIGLAQHYGVPTRALDWTWHPYVAAYFASDEGERDDSAFITVWIFDEYVRELSPDDQSSESSSPLVLYAVSGADNHNLRAQRGLFMLHKHHVDSERNTFKPITYDRFLFQTFHRISPARLLTRVLLPGRHRRSLRAVLARGGITAGSLYPGLWGVAREFEEQYRQRADSSYVERTRSLEELQEEYQAAVEKA